MTDQARAQLQRMTQKARSLLEDEYAEQLAGLYDIRPDGPIPTRPGAHLSEGQQLVWSKLVAVISHMRAITKDASEAVASYVRGAAFTTLNRFVALKMLEERGLVRQCISHGIDSSGFREFVGLAPALMQQPEAAYQLYLESIFDEIGREVGVLFDRRDSSSLLWPRRPALEQLLALLNAPELTEVWEEDQTIGWVYQYFNSEDERREMRKSSAPRNSRELAVRNQFFTPRYVVEFLTDNTLGRLWYEMMQGQTALAHLDFLVRRENEVFLEPGEEPPASAGESANNALFRKKKDPRDIKVLDPACGSGHFLLYAFDLLFTIYSEAWCDPHAASFTQTGRTLRQDYDSEEELQRAIPTLILEYNLCGIDIDVRAAQIAALALWLRVQRAYRDMGLNQRERLPVKKTNIVVAEPMPGDQKLVDVFAQGLEVPMLRELFLAMIEQMQLAGEMGSLLKVDVTLEEAIGDYEEQYIALQSRKELALPGFEPEFEQEELVFMGIENVDFFAEAGEVITDALQAFTEKATGASRVRRRLFADDATQGVAFVQLVRKRFDVVLMNPPFGAGSTRAKKVFDKAYPRTKNDVFAAFVERGIELLNPQGLLGAITSRTGFFLRSFQKWREDILLKEAPPVVFADLGDGVLDGAMVEVAAYCLEKIT